MNKTSDQGGSRSGGTMTGLASAQRQQEDRERQATLARATERSPKQENL